MSEGRNMVAELEAKLDGKDREIERLRAALREIADRPASISRNIARAALEGEVEDKT